MLKAEELKNLLHRDEFSQKDKALLILATFDKPCKIVAIKDRATTAGLRSVNSWNLSTILSRAKNLAIRVPEGWEITDSGRHHLRNLGVNDISPAAAQVAIDLRTELANIRNAETQQFLEETISCYELKLYRPAVVMSWLAAVHILYCHIHEKHLAAFNKEAKRVNSKWKDAITTDDIGKMGERDFLDRIAAISVIGKNVKIELINCLDRRNGCGHPNSYKLQSNTVAHHIEVLLLNVFQPFA